MTFKLIFIITHVHLHPFFSFKIISNVFILITLSFYVSVGLWHPGGVSLYERSDM